MDKPTIEIFLINLPRCKDRLEHFKTFNPNKFHYIEAIDGRVEGDTPLFENWPNLPANKVNANNYKALQLSMRKCIIAAKDMESCEWAVVCEDDAELPVNIDFVQIANKFKDSKGIWLDKRNKGGDGFVPGACMCCVMYHRSIFDFMIKELHPDTSTNMIHWKKERKGTAMVNDYYIAWIFNRNKVKGSSHPIVRSDKFKTTVRTHEWNTPCSVVTNP